MDKKSPEFSFKLGYVGGTVWKREHESRVYYNVTINRSYKDDDGKWNTTDSYGPEDLPVIAKVADVCLTWIIRAQQQTKA